MKAFRLTGTFRMGRKIQSFSKEVASHDKKGAEEDLYSILGSKHKVKRYDIQIDSVKELKPEDVEDSVVAFKVREEGK
jgi:large subunit ribosomal protein LX